jgi:hypothetical protein
MKCSKCGKENEASAQLCWNCWQPLASAPKIKETTHGNGDNRQSSPAIFDWIFGRTVELPGVQVISIGEGDPIISKSRGRGLQILISVACIAIVLWLVSGVIRYWAYVIFSNALLVIILFVAIGVMVGKSPISIGSVIGFFFNLLWSGTGAILRGSRSFGHTQQDRERRIPVKNVMVSNGGRPLLVRMEGYMTMGVVEPGHVLDITVRQKTSGGPLVFVRGRNRTLDCPLMVSLK